MSRLDEVSPTTMGEERISLSLDPSSKLRVGARVTVRLNYEAAEPTGVTPPIVVQAIPAREQGQGAQQQVFDRRPSSFAFAARTAGEWLIVARESAHNRWQGRLLVTIQGEERERRTR